MGGKGYALKPPLYRREYSGLNTSCFEYVSIKVEE
jgi:hypothetical protein